MTYLTVTHFATRHRQIEAELELEHAKAAERRVIELPPRRRSPRRWFRAVRDGVAA